MQTPGATASSRPWWYRTGVTTCGTPALVRVAGQVIPVGDCAGIFLAPAQQVTVQVGQQIDVRMMQETAGSSGNHLVPMFPLPRSSRPAVVADGTVSQDRASETYRAIRPGHAVLTAWRLVGSGEIRGSCPVLDITVVPSV
jgi:hypothetical protein